MAISTVSTIVLAVLVTPAIYILLSIFNYIRHTYAIIKAVKQWPGEPVHWLYGNMHQVSMVHNDNQGNSLLARSAICGESLDLESEFTALTRLFRSRIMR